MLGLFVAPSALGLVTFTIAAGVMAFNFWDNARRSPRHGDPCLAVQPSHHWRSLITAAQAL
jgi:uncharacterized membrane protein YphA (DoxX/SURF4 family)